MLEFARPSGVWWEIIEHACHIVSVHHDSHQQYPLNILHGKRQVQISYFRVGNCVLLLEITQRSHLQLRCHVVIR